MCDWFGVAPQAVEEEKERVRAHVRQGARVLDSQGRRREPQENGSDEGDRAVRRKGESEGIKIILKFSKEDQLVPLSPIMCQGR